jgi:hypothetical protein
MLKQADEKGDEFQDHRYKLSEMHFAYGVIKDAVKNTT